MSFSSSFIFSKELWRVNDSGLLGALKELICLTVSPYIHRVLLSVRKPSKLDQGAGISYLFNKIGDSLPILL